MDFQNISGVTREKQLGMPSQVPTWGTGRQKWLLLQLHNLAHSSGSDWHHCPCVAAALAVQLSHSIPLQNTVPLKLLRLFLCNIFLTQLSGLIPFCLPMAHHGRVPALHAFSKTHGIFLLISSEMECHATYHLRCFLSLCEFFLIYSRR